MSSATRAAVRAGAGTCCLQQRMQGAGRPSGCQQLKPAPTAQGNGTALVRAVATNNNCMPSPLLRAMVELGMSMVYRVPCSSSRRHWHPSQVGCWRHGTWARAAGDPVAAACANWLRAAPASEGCRASGAWASHHRPRPQRAPLAS